MPWKALSIASVASCLMVTISFKDLEAVTTTKPAKKEKPLQVQRARPMIKNRLKPVRVRLGLKLTPYQRVDVQDSKGKAQSKRVAATPTTANLRLRLEQVNHFYVGSWHIESVPQKWVKETKNYKVQLNLYRRYGALGNLEEKVGEIIAEGRLQGRSRLLSFVGQSERRFVTKTGETVLTAVVGPPQAQKVPALAKKKN